MKSLSSAIFLLIVKGELSPMKLQVKFQNFKPITIAMILINFFIVKCIFTHKEQDLKAKVYSWCISELQRFHMKF